MPGSQKPTGNISRGWHCFKEAIVSQQPTHASSEHLKFLIETIRAEHGVKKKSPKDESITVANLKGSQLLITKMTQVGQALSSRLLSKCSCSLSEYSINFLFNTLLWPKAPTCTHTHIVLSALPSKERGCSNSLGIVVWWQFSQPVCPASPCFILRVHTGLFKF